MLMPEGSWSLDDEASMLTLSAEAKGRTVTLTAPIHAADLTVDAAGVVLTLGIGIDQVRSGGFLLDTAMRAFLVGYGAHELLFVGSGPAGAAPASVGGVARSGRVAVDLDLLLDPVAQESSTQDASALTVAVSGTAVFEDVDVPLPGIGRLDALELVVSACLALRTVS